MIQQDMSPTQHLRGFNVRNFTRVHVYLKFIMKCPSCPNARLNDALFWLPFMGGSSPPQSKSALIIYKYKT